MDWFSFICGMGAVGIFFLAWICLAIFKKEPPRKPSETEIKLLEFWYASNENQLRQVAALESISDSIDTAAHMLRLVKEAK